MNPYGHARPGYPAGCAFRAAMPAISVDTWPRQQRQRGHVARIAVRVQPGGSRGGSEAIASDGSADSR